MPGSAHMSLAPSCLTCLAMKDDPGLVWQCQHTKSDEWTVTTATEGWVEKRKGEKWKSGRIERIGMNLFEAMSSLM